MNLAEYMPQALAALDAEPDSRLAISLDGLNRTGDRYLVELDLINAYIRKTSPDTMAAGIAPDIARFRRAADIIRGRVLLGGDLSYGNLRVNVHDLGGDLRDLADDSEARGIVSKILAAEPVLGWLVADRQDRKGRES